jgi:hypothetical protein
MLKSGEIEMDPADKAELMKNLAIIQEFAKDEKAVAALPQDVQAKLKNILAKAEKLAKGGGGGGGIAQSAGNVAGKVIKAPFRAVSDFAKGVWNAE